MKIYQPSDIVVDFEFLLNGELCVVVTDYEVDDKNKSFVQIAKKAEREKSFGQLSKKDICDYLNYFAKVYIHEAILLLAQTQSQKCPKWTGGDRLCNKPECEFCRVQRCIKDLENIVNF